MRINRMAGIAFALGAAAALPLLLARSQSADRVDTSSSATAIMLHQEISFDASPDRLYRALLDTKQFIGFSGRAAAIDSTVGGSFSLFVGHIIGRNLELVPERRIVQAWRVVTWPEGVYSIARFQFLPQGSGTRLVFDHVGFPAGLRDHLADGWRSNYWKPLADYLH